ncbi:hypothetical protein D3C87_1973610 [compost metagenome]
MMAAKSALNFEKVMASRPDSQRSSPNRFGRAKIVANSAPERHCSSENSTDASSQDSVIHSTRSGENTGRP